MEEFNKKGFPIIKLHEDCFEIKAIDFWEFRTFKYSEVVEIDYYNYNDHWLYKLGAFSSLFWAFRSEFEPYKLKIIKENGADWVYDAPPKYNREFASIIHEIIIRCGLVIVK